MDEANSAAQISIVIAAVSVGIAAASTFVAWHSSRRDQLAPKRDVLRRLVGNSYRLTSNSPGREGEPWVALNEAWVVYADSKPVTKAMMQMHRELGHPGRLTPNILSLVKAMAAEAKIPLDSLDEQFLSTPFTPPK